MVLGNSGTELANRIANRLYELCRTKAIDLPSFPNFAPMVEALREGGTVTSATTYKVCVQQHDRLKVLESMAGKWMQTECLKDQAESMIKEHNEKYNPNGELWVEDRRSLAGVP